jgi:phytoene synthase
MTARRASSEGSRRVTRSGRATAPGGTVCQALTKASRSNFTYAFRFLPKPKREALYAVYAFCRVTDDLVDEAASIPPGVTGELSPFPLERLKAWRGELDACFRGEATRPITERLAGVIQAYRIPQRYFEELLDGVEMDLVKARYATFAELEQYCYRVAGVVGLICIEIFGYTQPGTRCYATLLGTAFQLTNILRDVDQDLRRDRIYLPQEDLVRFGCAEADLFARRMTPAFRELMQFEAARARSYYARAADALPPEDRRAMLPGAIMAAIYRRILEGIPAVGYDVFAHRVRLSDGHRLLLALGCWLRHLLTRA